MARERGKSTSLRIISDNVMTMHNYSHNTTTAYFKVVRALRLCLSVWVCLWNCFKQHNLIYSRTLNHILYDGSLFVVAVSEWIQFSVAKNSNRFFFLFCSMASFYTLFQGISDKVKSLERQNMIFFFSLQRRNTINISIDRITKYCFYYAVSFVFQCEFANI